MSKKMIGIIKDKKMSWSNYHVTKHFIVGLVDEGFDRLLGIHRTEVLPVRDKQIKDYDCKVEGEVTQKNSCNPCKAKRYCYVSLNDFSDKYYQLIEECLVYDLIKPRHAIFSNDGNRFSNLVVIAENGTVVVSAKIPKKNQYSVNTSYRYSVDDADMEDYRYLATHGDRWFLYKAKRMWNNKLANKIDYTVKEKNIEDNWV